MLENWQNKTLDYDLKKYPWHEWILETIQQINPRVQDMTTINELITPEEAWEIQEFVQNSFKDVVYQKKDNNKFEKREDMRTNSIKRIAHQRNKIMDYLNEANDEDFIFYSDNDEIPNLENLNFDNIQNKIVIFCLFI